MNEAASKCWPVLLLGAGLGVAFVVVAGAIVVVTGTAVVFVAAGVVGAGVVVFMGTAVVFMAAGVVFAAVVVVGAAVVVVSFLGMQTVWFVSFSHLVEISLSAIHMAEELVCAFMVQLTKTQDNPNPWMPQHSVWFKSSHFASGA